MVSEIKELIKVGIFYNFSLIVQYKTENQQFKFQKQR